MVLIQLLPEQVMDYWDYIKDCILQSLPPLVAQSDETMLYVQSSVLVGDLQVWIAAEDLTLSKTYGVATTQVVIEPITSSRNLLIFTTTITDAHPESLWHFCLGRLSVFAKNRGCQKLIAHSDIPKVLEIVEKLGGDTSYRLIQLPILDEVEEEE